ncbi:MAG: ABC transporter permease [Candidatus Methanofastidiosia archaeon]
MMRKQILRDLGISIGAVVLALFIGFLIIFFTGYNPVKAYLALFSGAFGDYYAIAQTLTKTTPLIFTGLCVALAFQCGLFNIGGEGQLYVGALASAFVGIYFDLPFFFHIPLAIIFGALTGGIWGIVPGFLKARFGAHEVITTIMMNYIGILFCSYLVNKPFKAEGWVAQTVIIKKSSQLPKLIPHTQLSAAIILAIVCVYITYFILWKTTIGYEIRAVGLNPLSAEYGGISISKNIVLAMFLSGAIAGMGGAGEVMGLHKRFIDGFSPGYGFDGIAVAILGRNHPFGVVLAALLFGALRSGGMTMDRITDVPADLILVIQALVILFVAAPQIISYIGRIRNVR